MATRPKASHPTARSAPAPAQRFRRAAQIPVVALVALALAGCAAFWKLESGQTEQNLIAAGFRVVPANTPARQASLSSLEPYKLTSRAAGNRMIYLYADPDQNALYIGGPSEYRKYESLLVQQQLTEEQEMTAALNQETAEDWEDWDTWGPW